MHFISRNDKIRLYFANNSRKKFCWRLLPTYLGGDLSRQTEELLMAAGSPVPSVKMEELHMIMVYIFAPSSRRNREKRWMNKKEQDEMLQE